MFFRARADILNIYSEVPDHKLEPSSLESANLISSK